MRGRVDRGEGEKMKEEINGKEEKQREREKVAITGDEERASGGEKKE